MQNLLDLKVLFLYFIQQIKLIISYLRASMSQDRLWDLALLSVERGETEIIEQFESVIASKMQL